MIPLRNKNQNITEAGFSRELELAFTPERFSEVLEDC